MSPASPMGSGTLPQRPLDRLLAPGREKQRLFTSFVHYIQRKKSLSDETAAREWVARQLAFPVDRLHYKISFCNERSRAEESVDELNESLPEGSTQQVEEWLNTGARLTLWRVNWVHELMWPDTLNPSLEHCASPHLFMHIWYWKFGKEFRCYLRKQKRAELLGVLEKHNPFLDEYRWQSPAVSGGLLLGIITGKLPGAQAAKEKAKEERGETDKDKDPSLLQRLGMRRRSLSAGDLKDLANLDTEKLVIPDLLRHTSGKARTSGVSVGTEDIHKGPSFHDLLSGGAAADGGGRSGSPGPIGDRPELFLDAHEDECEEGKQASPVACANHVLWRGMVVTGRHGALYQVTQLACPHAHVWPMVGAFAERVDGAGGEDLAWDAPRPRVYVTAIMAKTGGQNDRRLARLKEAMDVFKSLPQSAFVKVHDHVLVRGAGAGGDFDAAYCVVMDRLESSLGRLLESGSVSLSLRYVKSLAIETARTLRTWHTLGRAHGGVQLHNLFLSTRPGHDGEHAGGGWKAELGCIDLVGALGEEGEGGVVEEKSNGALQGHSRAVGLQQAKDVYDWGLCWLHVLLAGGAADRMADICASGDVASRERAIFNVIGRQAGSLVAAIARAISEDPVDRPSMQGLVGILTFRQRWSGDLPELPDRVMDMHDGSLRKIKRAIVVDLPKGSEPGGWAEASMRVKGEGAQAEVVIASPQTTVSSHGPIVSTTNRSPILQVCGMGGVGKSILVQRALEDPEVWARYPDGIIWVAMRQEGTDDERLQRKQLRLLRHLLGPEAFHDLHLAEGDGPRLLSNPMLWSALCREKLSSKACLVVVDGVWQTEHARAFDFLGPKALLLLTTRRNLVGQEGRAKTLKLRELTDRTGPLATALLLTYARRVSKEEGEDEAREEEERLLEESENAALVELERVCEGLPLALSLVGSMRRGAGMTWGQIRDLVMQAGGREAMASQEGQEGRGGNGHGKYAGLHAVLTASVKALGPEEMECLKLYTVLRENTWVEEGLVSAVMQLDKEETLSLLKGLAARSLIRLETKSHRSSIHGLIRGYVRSTVSMEAQVDMHMRTLIRGVKGTIVCGPDKVFDQPDEQEQLELPYLRENFWYHMEQLPDRLDALTPTLFTRVRTMVLYRFWGVRWGLIKAILRRCERLETFRAYREAGGGGKSSLWGHDMEGVFKTCADSLRVLSFPSAKLAGRGNDSLLKGLRHCSRLEVLDLPHLTMGEEGAKALVEVVLKCSASLTGLNLRVSNAGSFGIDKALLSALRLCKALTSLDMSHCGFNASGAQVLVTVLADCPRLIHLRLDGNQLGSRLGAALKGRPERCVALRSLSLSCSGLEDGSMEALRTLVGQCCKLESLDLSKNRMGPLGAKLLSSALSQWRVLRHLNLSYSCSADKECKALTWALSEALALASCPELASLDLRGIALDDEEATALGQALQVCQVLESVLLSADGLSLTGAERLAAGFRRKQDHNTCLYLCVHDPSHEGKAKRVERRFVDLNVQVRRVKPDEAAETVAAPARSN